MNLNASEFVLFFLQCNNIYFSLDAESGEVFFIDVSLLHDHSLLTLFFKQIGRVSRVALPVLFCVLFSVSCNIWQSGKFIQRCCRPKKPREKRIELKNAISEKLEKHDEKVLRDLAFCLVQRKVVGKIGEFV